MRIHTGFLLVILFFSITANAQPDWQWAHPYPTGSDIRGVSFIDGNCGWIATHLGEVFYTSDGGVTWALLEKTPFSFFDLQFLDSMHGWSCGQHYNDGFAGLTTDGGNTWQTASLGLYAVESIEFIDENYGTITSHNGMIYRTMNGGTTWTEQGSGVSGGLLDVSFISIADGWICGTDGICLSTSTAGAFWESVTTPAPGADFYGIHFIDTLKGFLAGEQYILETVDGGDSWTIPFNLPGAELKALDMSGVLGVAVGVNGAAVSDDQGTTWTWEGFPGLPSMFPTNTFKSVSVADQQAWAGGPYGLLYKRNSSGNWQKLSSHETLNPLNAITHSGPDHVWACGDDGVLMRSTDGGATWESQVCELDADLEDICFPSLSIGYAVGNLNTDATGVILKSSDGGVTWSSVTPAGTTANGFRSIDFLDTLNGVAVAANGIIECTNDGGVSWETNTQFSSLSFNDVRFSNTDRGWAVGSSGSIVCFDFLSDSWTQQTGSMSNTYFAVYPVNEDAVWAVGWNGTVSKTNNAGNLWETINVTGNDYSDVWFAEDGLNGFFSSGGYTTDGGYTINSLPYHSIASYSSVSMVDPGYGWSCGYYGHIFRLGTEPSAMDEMSEPVPSSAGSILTPGVNPFSLSTSICVELHRATEVSLGLYDLSGRLVENIYRGELTPGSHSFDINGNSMPPGIYFAVLEGNGVAARTTLVRVR